jgi:uncharacterized membrane protein YeaQ/YmgE (transglycosylase-associated protein family)
MLTALIVAIVIGAIAGWLAGLLVQGTGFGLVGDIVIGILGALIASVLFPRLGYRAYARGRLAWRDPARLYRRGDPARDRADNKASRRVADTREYRAL